MEKTEALPKTHQCYKNAVRLQEEYPFYYLICSLLFAQAVTAF